MFSDPVVGDDFFGRQAVLDLLVKRASALKSGYRQNVAIIGHRQTGKTSILRQFLHLQQDPDVLPIYVEIKLSALDYFVDQFARALLYRYLVSVGAPADPTESAASLAEKAASRIPKTVARIHDIGNLLKHRHFEEAYFKLFELTSILRQETGKHCIVVLDEFHRLGEFGVRNAFSDFGKRIMLQKDTMYLLSSSAFTASRRILAEKLALLFGNFERIYLEPFDFETTFRFVQAKSAPLQVPDTLRYFLAAFTDGHPFFLDSIVTRARECGLARGESALSRASLGEALAKLLFESQGVLYQYFLKLLSPWTHAPQRGSSHVLILTQLAKGRNKLKDLAKAVNRSQAEVSEQISELMAHELVVKTGVFYRFHDKMFKFWLREVYERKELSLDGPAGKADDFLRRIDALISEYEEFRRLDVSERIGTLFSQFRNEIIELGEKRRQLPHFTEIVRSSSTDGADGSVRRLIAKGQGRCWVCRITEDRATEREVLEAVEGVSSRASTQTPVLVALGGLDDNAKLLAKEKRVLTLGLSRINMLMDLYGGPPIVRADG